MNVYPFIEAEKTDDGNVAATCRVLEVSSSAFYQWARHAPSRRELGDACLLEQIRAVHDQSRGTYGSQRVHAELVDRGVACGRHRVARLMREHGIVGRAPKRFRTTTVADPDAQLQAAVDLVKRGFGPGTVELDTVWVSDLTYIRTWEGWAYLVTVIDLASRKVVGWAMADHMRTELITQAVRGALHDRRPDEGLVFHSDRGCQYTSGEFGELLAENGMVQSLSRKGQCWDNAVAESFFSTLKTELIHGRVWPTREAARRAVFDYIESFYNTKRRHSSLGYLSPANYERRIMQGASSTGQAA